MKFVSIIFISLLVLSCAYAGPIRPYTHYGNCHPSWANEVIGDTGKTICEEGSLTTCLAMVLQYYSASFGREPANPKTLQKYLNSQQGRVFEKINKLVIQYSGTIHSSKVKEYYDQGFDVILNLNGGSNYGVLLSYNDDIYYIHNPANKDVNKVKQADITVGLVFKKKEK